MRSSRLNHQTKWHIFIIVMLSASILLESSCAKNVDSDKKEIGKLQGTWQLVYQQQNGKKLPDEQTAKMFEGKMAVAGNKIHYTVLLPGFDFTFVYKLDSSQQPKTIDLESINPEDNYVNGRFLGIYTLDKNTLKICYNKSKRPTDFNAEAGVENVLIVLKR